MCGRPPGSALFPYTTLFRSGGVRSTVGVGIEGVNAILHRRYINDVMNAFSRNKYIWQVERLRIDGSRSEEHTSELQSHSDLVCRLLLEKKEHPHRIVCDDDV